MRVSSSYNNFSRAKIDHDMMGRFDLPIYQTGLDICQNFITNFKGNSIYRTGLESMIAFQDCVFQEFLFGNNQNYLLMFFANKIRFMAYDTNGNFGYVLSGGVPLEVTTPYTLTDCRTLQFTQNADVMVITHPNYRQRKLIRTAANAFNFNTFAIKDDPFGLTYAATQTITAVTKATNAQVTVAAHGRSVGDLVKIAGIVGMTELNGWTARVASLIDANNYTIDVDTTTYTAYSSGGTTALLLTSDNPACCLFSKGKLYYARSGLKITTIWASQSAQYDIFTIPATTLDTSAFQITLADISTKIEWLFEGENSLVAGAAEGIVALNGGAVGAAITAATVQAKKTSAQGCNSTIPLAKDGLVFYVSRDNRHLYYFSYDLLTERFTALDANFISFDITLGGMGKIRYKKDRNDLIFAIRAGDLLSCNFLTGEENIIGWHDHETLGLFKDVAVMADNNGDPQIFSLTLRNGTYYVERQGKYPEFVVRDDFFTGADNETLDSDAFTRFVAEQLKQVFFLDNAQAVSDLRTSTLTFLGGNTISSTAADFSAGSVGKQIVYKTATGYEYGRFEITGYTDTQHVTVSVLQQPSQNIYSNWYLTFSSITGLSQYNGQTIGVVTDGGYLKDFLVTGGTISLGSQATYAVVGYKYTGTMKSFCLGFQIQAENTQYTMKVIYEAHIRFSTTAGGMFGTSPYDLQPIQQLKEGDLNYLPPIPMDGTQTVSYGDDHKRDKFFYIEQPEPLPMTIACVGLDSDYARTK